MRNGFLRSLPRIKFQSGSSVVFAGCSRQDARGFQPNRQVPRSLRLLKGVQPDQNEKRYLQSLGLALQKKDAKTGASMVKANKRKLVSTADCVKALSNCMENTLGHGLQVYLPVRRLAPGAPLQVLPETLQDRPLLKVLVDECAVGFSAANYLIEVSGVRMLVERDPCHRDWNDAFRGVQHAGLQGLMPSPPSAYESSP